MAPARVVAAQKNRDFFVRGLSGRTPICHLAFVAVKFRSGILLKVTHPAAQESAAALVCMNALRHKD
jgi:hypothetical protein